MKKSKIEILLDELSTNRQLQMRLFKNFQEIVKTYELSENEANYIWNHLDIPSNHHVKSDNDLIGMSKYNSSVPHGIKTKSLPVITEPGRNFSGINTTTTYSSYVRLVTVTNNTITHNTVTFNTNTTTNTSTNTSNESATKRYLSQHERTSIKRRIEETLSRIENSENDALGENVLLLVNLITKI